MKKNLVFWWLMLLLSKLMAQQLPVFTIDQGASTACYGVLFDTGGPDGDYQNNEYHVFQICPEEPPACLLLELSYYEIEFTELGVADQLLFYDGPEVDPRTLIAAIGGSNFSVGTDGGGGVCYRVAAGSGCLTVQFASDGLNTFSGFAAQWSCRDEDCPNTEPLDLVVAPAPADILAGLATPSAPLLLRSLRCDSTAYGWFVNGDRTELGLGQGLVLTTGEAAYAAGPNDSDGSVNFFTADRGQPGDSDLDSLARRSGSEVLSQDACILELDVTPNSNTLEFAYVFASEEYPEYVLREYNDIFAFLVSGPGVVGPPWLNGQLNVASLPDGTVVEINSVNNQLNWPYFRNNHNGQGIQYDGLSADSLGQRKSLLARTVVQPCSTYTLKLAIADRGDGVFDSGVFIGKIRGGSPELSLVFANGLDVLSESCGLEGNILTIQYDNPASESLIFTIDLEGSATPGQDYILDLPGELSFPPGLSTYTFELEVLADAETQEGLEDIRISLTHDFGCGTPLQTELVLELEDYQAYGILGPDTLLGCPQQELMLVADGPGPYLWSPREQFVNPRDSMVRYTADSWAWVYLLRRRSALCQWRDSVYVVLSDADDTLEIQAGTTTLCRGDSVWLRLANTQPLNSVRWVGPEGRMLGSGDSIRVAPAESGSFRVEYARGDCEFTSEIMLRVDALLPLELPEDSLLCPDQALIWMPEEASTVVTSWVQLTGPNPGQVTASLDIAATEMEVETDRERRYAYQRSLGSCQSLDTASIRRSPRITLGVDTTTLEWPGAAGNLELLARPLPRSLPEVLRWETAEEVIGTGSSVLFSPEDYDYPSVVYARYQDECQELLDSILIHYALVILPDFISPNGDGVNDRFQPFSPQAFDYYELTIYNRWGQVIYRQQGPELPVWTGEVDSQAAPADVYLYNLYLRRAEEELVRRGNFTLVR